MFCMLKNIIILIAGIITICEFKVIVKLRIYNYQNENDVKHDGWKCESFHWLNDHCDPMFDVCVSSKYRCDVVNHFVSHWKNKKYVSNVLSRTIRLDYMQRSLIVEVKAVDHDRFDAHDHIATFTSHFEITHLNMNYGKQMSVSPSGLNVHLYASIIIRCDDRYYGHNCDVYCSPQMFNYKCERDTGTKICLIECGIHGFCEWQLDSQEFTCKCNNGWTGDSCQTIKYTNCSKLSCSPRCINYSTHLYCKCSYGSYSESCSEPYKITTKSTLKPISTRKLTKSTTTTTTTVQPTTNTTTTVNPTSTKKTTTVLTTTILPSTAKMSPTKYRSTLQFVTSTNLSKISSNTPTADNTFNHKETPVQYLKFKNRKEKDSELSHSSSLVKPEESDVIKLQKSDNNEESIKQHLATLQKSYHNPTTIIIICLLILLCICIIILSIVIRGWKRNYKFNKNGYFQSSHTQRPLPPVYYLPDKYPDKIISSVLTNPNLPCLPEYEYDQCAILPREFNTRKDNKYNTMNYMNDHDIYEEPIINNMDSMTCETDIMESDGNGSDNYEEPIKAN